MSTESQAAEAMIRSFLMNAAAKHVQVSVVAPEVPSADYLSGASAGYLAGEVAGLALAVSVLTGESAGDLALSAEVAASVESAFPFDLHLADEAGREMWL